MPTFNNLNNLGKVYTITCGNAPLEFDVEEDLDIKLIN